MPKDFWRTYSAMANAQGGVVLFGVQEKAGQFSVAGLKNPTRVRENLFNTLNNRAKVSTNLLKDADVTTAVVDSRNVLVISIPAATRKQKPVLLNGQPLGNTWLRLNDGDNRRVYRKLTSDLKVPFAIKDGQRQEDTPVHVALREALVNTLVHADYTGRLSVLVVKRPDMFGFRNPGRLRLPIEQVLRGGESDCRNRILHQMFLLIGLGERGGSGVPKIYSGWKSQHWRPPALEEKVEPEQTLLTLQMADLLPEHVLVQLKSRFGKQFEELDYTGRLVMATAAMERVVSHKRLLEICRAHPHDLSQQLARLVKQGLLESDGKPRGMVYFLPGESLPTPDQVFMGPTFPSMDAGIAGSSSEHSQPTSEHSQPTSEHLAHDSEDVLGSGERDAQGRMLSAHLDAPIVDDLNKLEPTFLSALKDLAQEPAQWSRLERSRMESVILSICQDQFLTLSAMSQLVCRSPDGLRQQYLSRMVKRGSMTLAFPTKPTHEKQAYRAAPGAFPLEVTDSPSETP